MNPSEVAQLIAFVSHSWPTVPVRHDDARVMVATWHAHLTDIELGDAIEVVKRWAARAEPFPPAPGVIVHEMREAADRATGTRAPDVDEAWAEVMRGVARLGYVQGPPAWTHPAIDATVRAVTWRDICLGENPMSTRSQFVRMYDTARTRIVREQREPVAAMLTPPRVDPAELADPRG